MIFTKIEIDNFYGFKNAVLDLTLKREEKNSTIKDEFLEERVKYRYKRVCILIGPNASGKTSLGRLMCSFQNWMINYFEESKLKSLSSTIRDKNKKAALGIEFVSPNTKKAHKFLITISPHKNIDSNNDDVQDYDIFYAQTNIGVNDSSRKVSEKLSNIITSHTATRGSLYVKKGGQKFKKALDGIFNDKSLEWYYRHSNNEGDIKRQPADNLNARILDKVLSTFDPSIINVAESRDDDGKNGFSIKFRNGDKILMNLKGQIAEEEINRLSKGTYEAIHAADLVSDLISTQKNDARRKKMEISISSCTYFFDEKLSFSHDELEKALLNIILDKLPRHAQLFYTTHNMGILELNYPAHSFVLLKKDGEFSSFIHPEETFKKNDRSLLNYVKNDVFSTLPSVTELEELLWEDE